MAIARIDNGQVIETRDIALTDVPDHKRLHWRVLVDTPSPGWGAQPVYNVGQTEVTRTWTLPGQDSYAAAVQSHVDGVAALRGYANGFALASYVPSSVTAWAAEASTFVAWRDAVWLYVYTQLAAVQSQQRSQPTPAELVAELPVIQWPAP